MPLQPATDVRDLARDVAFILRGAGREGREEIEARTSPPPSALVWPYLGYRLTMARNPVRVSSIDSSN